MATVSISSTARATRAPISALSRLAIGALIGLALALGYVQAFLLHEFALDLTIFAGLMLGGAALIATGWRWAPALGGLLSTLVVLGNGDKIVFDLTHPESFHIFTYMIVAVSLALVGMATGYGAAVQNYRSAERRAPRAIGVALAALVGLGVGAVLVAAVPREAGTGVSPATLAQLPAITIPEMRFDTSELKAHAGELVALRLENQHGAPHSFDIDELGVHVPVSAGKQGLILFKAAKPGTYTFYCSVPGHRQAGMQGTLVVEP
jgi:nitrite reductase (NO-forming)